jgi:multidrug efflux pump subunit AcrA (membrane-fusion protein)
MPRKKLIWAAVAIVVLGLGGRRLLGHSATEPDDPEHAVAADAVVSAVAKVERGPIENTLTIAGEFKPFQDADVHAKVAGYIKKIYVDVGDHVKGGQTLAVLEVPELEGAGRRSKEESQRRRINISAILEGETMRFTWLDSKAPILKSRKELIASLVAAAVVAAAGFAIGSASLASAQDLSRQPAAEAAFLRERLSHDENDESHGREALG